MKPAGQKEFVGGFLPPSPAAARIASTSADIPRSFPSGAEDGRLDQEGSELPVPGSARAISVANDRAETEPDLVASLDLQFAGPRDF